MTTDLRAALREAAALLREDAQEHIDDARKQAAAPLLQMAERLEALADAPPTVAELLPLVDATHEVRWVAADGFLWRAALVNTDGGDRVSFDILDSGEWSAYCPLASDFARPATLVEVTP